MKIVLERAYKHLSNDKIMLLTGDLGFGGHCLPKDLNAIIKLTNDLGSLNNVLKSALKTNNKVRKNRDWENMKGRAIN